MQVRKLMNRECELFFCIVLDVSKEVGVKIEDVPMVNEFFDVFRVKLRVRHQLEPLSSQ